MSAMKKHEALNILETFLTDEQLSRQLRTRKKFSSSVVVLAVALECMYSTGIKADAMKTKIWWSADA